MGRRKREPAEGYAEREGFQEQRDDPADEVYDDEGTGAYGLGIEEAGVKGANGVERHPATGRFIRSPADRLAVGHDRDPGRVPGQGAVPAADPRGIVFEVDQQPAGRPLGGFPVTGTYVLRPGGSSPLMMEGTGGKGTASVVVQTADLRSPANRASFAELHHPVDADPSHRRPSAIAPTGAAPALPRPPLGSPLTNPTALTKGDEG